MAAKGMDQAACWRATSAVKGSCITVALHPRAAAHFCCGTHTSCQPLEVSSVPVHERLPVQARPGLQQHSRTRLELWETSLVRTVQVRQTSLYTGQPCFASLTSVNSSTDQLRKAF